MVRGGYGINYGNSVTEDVRSRMGNICPFRQLQTISRNSSNPGFLTLDNPFPGGGSVDTSSTGGYEMHAPSQYLQTWNFTLERQIGANMALEGG